MSFDFLIFEYHLIENKNETNKIFFHMSEGKKTGRSMTCYVFELFVFACAIKALRYVLEASYE